MKTMNSYETIGDIKTAINAAITSTEFVDRLKNIHNHDGFHKLVREFIIPILPPEISFSTWTLIVKSMMTENEIFSYHRTFTAYKNSTRSDKGNFSNVWFTISNGLSETMTINQAAVHLRTFQLNKRISEFTELISKKEKEIADYKQYIADFQNELKTLSEGGVK